VPAVLFLTLAFAALAARSVERALVGHPWLDALLLVPVYLVATNIATVDLQSSKDAFSFRAPSVIVASAEFHHVVETPYKYSPDWHQIGRQLLLGMYANTGLLRCYATPHELITGAIAQGAPGYRGEAYIVGAAPAALSGTAHVTKWTPNTATVRYEGASPGSTLVYNMNYDPSWLANGSPAINYRATVATLLTSSAGEVTFRYYPRTLNWGLLICAFTALIGFGGPRVRRAGYSLWARRVNPPKTPMG
jgi:hypothetical protein